MKYIDEFRDEGIARRWAERISSRLGDREVALMEVCGTHTMAIHRYGLLSMLPPNLRLLSGPGCPVCVTPKSFLDRAIALSREKDVIIATFGDMMRVPGSSSSLEKEKAKGGDIRVVYSPLDSLRIASRNPERRLVFLGIGFETTAPAVATSILEAEKAGLLNYSVLVSHKLIPPAMGVLASDPGLRVDGFICPGHVSTIIGSEPYRFIAEDYGVLCVIAGFEPLDMLQGIGMSVDQIIRGRAGVEIQYSRVVKREGNRRALQVMEEVFEPGDAEWRGLGVIPGSGLGIRERYRKFDAELNFEIQAEETRESRDCICGSVLKGTKTPLGCKLFGTVCTPEDPQGACMVSSEGTCAAYYKYGGERYAA